jgi:hypothetical protein
MASFLSKQKLPKQNILFLGHLFVAHHPTGHFILVLDNASIHKSVSTSSFQAWLILFRQSSSRYYVKMIVSVLIASLC